MKIRLIEPRSPSNNVYDHAMLPRLGLPQMGAILRQQGHDIRIYVEALAPVRWEDLFDADLAGFSTTTATTPPAYAMADRLRAQGIPVVFGGAHVTFLPDEALTHADYVVRGEGHSSLVELVDAIQMPPGPDREAALARIAGLSWHTAAGIRHNEARPNCPEAAFADLPVPDLSLIEGRERMFTTPIMTQWGCPYDCNFCSVIKMFGRRVRARRVEDVLDQLAGLPKGADVFFYDDNFVVDRRRTKALLRGMIERGIRVNWSAQLRADSIYMPGGQQRDGELLDLMRASGCHTVYVGFESVNPAALAEINKHQSVETIAESIRSFHDYGINIHGMFVLGCDSDTPQTIDATVRFAIDHEIDTVQFLSITPLPGTDFYDQMKGENRILTGDWSLYDGHHVLIEPKGMSPYALQRLVMGAMLRFYAPRRAWGLLLRNLRRELPFLLRLLIREQKLRLALGRIALLSFRPRQMIQLPDLLHNALGDQWRRLRAVFIIPVFRSYAFWHTRQGLRQPQNRQYMAWLRQLGDG